MSYLTIPTWRNPYVVEINGKKYAYKAGEYADVPDEVAEVIQRDIDQHTQEVEPALTQPRWGSYKVTSNEHFVGYYDDRNGCVTEMDKETYAMLLEQNAVATLYDYEDQEIGTIPVSEMSYCLYDIFPGEYERDCLMYYGDAAYFMIPYVKEEEKFVPIPAEYTSGGTSGGTSAGDILTVRFTYDYDTGSDFYTADKTDAEIINAILDGKLVVGIYGNFGTTEIAASCAYDDGAMSGEVSLSIGSMKSNLDGTWS